MSTSRHIPYKDTLENFGRDDLVLVAREQFFETKSMSTTERPSKSVKSVM